MRKRLSISDLKKRYKVDGSTIYRWYKKGAFPEPHYLGRDRRWFEDVVDAWDQKQMAASAKQAETIPSSLAGAA
ncbi:MAG: AlpA family transcriptional regulator [Gammaproteobacteria bacterium]|nr:AlpA family transcriptional regulator [Gammaproteobacteria bacterium]